MQYDFLLNQNGKHGYIPIRIETDNCYSMPYIPTSFIEVLDLKKFDKLLDWVKDNQLYEDEVKLDPYLEKVEERLGDIVIPPTDIKSLIAVGRTHGDLTLENIRWDKDFVFIDPKGNQPMPSYYDYSKIAQSLLVLGKESYMKDLSRRVEDPWLLDFFLAIHLLGAVRFIEKRDPVLADRFYKHGLQYLNVLEIEYEQIKR